MTLVVPHAWTAGDDATSVRMKTLTDGITQLQGGAPTAGALDFAVLNQIVTQSLTTSVWGALTFTSEGCDFASGHSITTNTSRYTAVHAGWYQCNAAVLFVANTTGQRGLKFGTNGTGLPGWTLVPATSALQTAVALSKKIYLAAGDYVEAFAFQSSGGALSTSYTAPDQGSFMDVQWCHS